MCRMPASFNLLAIWTFDYYCIFIGCCSVACRFCHICPHADRSLHQFIDIDRSRAAISSVPEFWVPPQAHSHHLVRVFLSQLFIDIVAFHLRFQYFLSLIRFRFAIIFKRCRQRRQPTVFFFHRWNANKVIVHIDFNNKK